MMAVKRVRIGVVFASMMAASFSAAAEYRVVQGPIPGDPMAVTIYELDNGLTVYLSENHEQPRFYAEIAVRAGSKHDPAETTGLAHYLEHLLFKGTQALGTLDYEKEKPHLERITELYEQHFHETDPAKREAIYAEINKETQLSSQYAIPNELDRLYKAMGGTSLNAHTSNEETVYKVELPSNRLEQWAIIESHRFEKPVFRLFQPELEIVYEEKNRSMDNKGRIIGEAVNELLYKKHPYGQQTTLGSVEHLKKPSLVNIYNYFETYYVPNNMAICISGDINKEDTMRIVDAHFSSWQPGKVPRTRRWREKPLEGAERVVTRYPGEPYVLLAFRTASQTHRDAGALRLLDMVLSNRSAGLIDLNLVHQQRVRGAGSYPQLMNDYGAQYLWGIPKDGQSLEEVENLLLEQLELVKRGEFEDWIIPAIITDFKKNRKAGLESDQTRVSYMREAYIAHEDWADAVSRIDRMARLTKDDVVRVAKRYFAEDYVAGYREDGQHEVPKIEKPKIDTIQIDAARQSKFARDLLAMPIKPLEPVFVDPAKDYSIVDDPAGIRLYYVKNPINDLFSLTFAFDVGMHHNNRLPAAAELLDKSGTTNLSPEDLQKEWYRLGTGFRFGVDYNESSAAIEGLDENFEASLALLMDVMTNATADQATLDELIRIILARRDDAKKDPQTISSALVQYQRYGEDSTFLQSMSSEEVRKLTVAELHGAIRDLIGYKHAVLYVGSLPKEKVVELMKKHHPVVDPLRDPPPYHFRRVRSPDATEIMFFDKEVAQSQIQIAIPCESYDETHIPAINLYNSYFGGGMAGIVFQELREARALAYSVGARYVTGGRKGEQNVMVGGMGSQVDKTPEGVEAFVDLLDNMPVSPERFATAKDALINSFVSSRLGFREILPAVRGWERLEVAVDPRRERYERILTADIETMLGFYRDQIAGRPKLISIVGAKSKLDMDRLSRAGRIAEAPLERLFVE